MANSLFLQEGVTFNPDFLRLMRKYFRAEVETVDFSESAAVAEQINTWVENHTESELVCMNRCVFMRVCIICVCARVYVCVNPHVLDRKSVV